MTDEKGNSQIGQNSSEARWIPIIERMPEYPCRGGGYLEGKWCNSHRVFQFEGEMPKWNTHWLRIADPPPPPKPQPPTESPVEKVWLTFCKTSATRGTLEAFKAGFERGEKYGYSSAKADDVAIVEAIIKGNLNIREYHHTDIVLRALKGETK